MDDYISRQAVLSYIDRIMHQGTGKQKSFEFIRKYVEKMPFEEMPNRTEESAQNVPNDDLVSRKAVIDALNDKFTIIGKTNAIAVQDYIRRVNNRLHDLPSTQPIITCDGCRFVSTYDTEFPCCSCVRREKDYYAPER